MKSLFRQWCAGLCALVAIWGGGAAVAAEPALQVFFGDAPLRVAKLSPSGRWVAAVVQPKGARARLVVTDLDEKEPSRVIAQFSRVDVGRVFWVNDDWLVFDTEDLVNRDAEWTRRGRGLMAVARSGERMRLLVKREFDTAFPPPGSQPLEANHQLLTVGDPSRNEVIVGELRFDGRYQVTGISPLALDVSTGTRRSLGASLPSDVVSWVFDAKGRPRAAVSIKDDKARTYWTDLTSGEWKQLGEFPRLEIKYSPRWVDDHGRLLVAHSDKAGFGAVSRYDVVKGAPDGEPLVSTPGFSGGTDLIQDRDTDAIVGFQVLTDARSLVWTASAARSLQERVDARFPGRVNLMACGRCDAASTALVYSYSDRSPGEYLVFRPASGKWARFGAVRPDVDEKRMATTDLHRIKARDGLDLPVWVTRPAGAETQARAAVVLVHGGPWVRGREWGWNATAQFLASRGYVVIEPEFRGSTGYGFDHYRAGWRQWGQAMQDDVSDSLSFGVKQGWVDPKRVCIAGASYGGYSTLMGLAKDPEQYRCGVAWVAVSDPLLMFRAHWSDISSEHKLHTMPQMIGDPVADAAMLRANSPLEHAARIKSPVLLAYGALDLRVPLDHGTRMREALTRAGNPPEWVVYEDEHHGFRKPENRLDFWARVERFLAQHLK